VSHEEIDKVKKIICESNEPKDAIFHLSDNDLIMQLKKILQICNDANIMKYYQEHKIKYRCFNLSGLFSEKYGIKTEKQRKIIRDMFRRCIQFTHTEYFKNITKIAY
jgi:hypothetical protein